MGWGDILKRAGGISLADIRLINYILSDGEFKTAEAVMDEIYDLLQENRKMTPYQISLIDGRPHSTRFGTGLSKVKDYMTKSPDYEARNTGNKTHGNKPVKEYRYIGE